MSTYPYPMHFEVDAIYTSSKDLPPNPLRDALPPQLTRSEVLEHIKYLPPYSEKDRHEPSPDEKFLLLDRILQVFYPLVYYVDLQRAVDRAVRNSYEHRTPLDPKFYSLIVAAAQSISQFKMPPGLAKSDCCGFAIAGDSGIGKTLTLTRTLQLLPQVINHSTFNGKPFPFRQVPWIKVNCPEYASTRALEVEMLKAYDTVLGTDYVGLYDKPRVNAKALASHLARVACYHGTGVAVIDELQNLALAPSGGQDEMLGFFSNFMYTFGQPIILVGTVAAVRLLSSRFSQARRATGYSNPIWTRLERNDPDWEILLRALWKYQYTEVETLLDSELSDVMHECTQGIADNVAKLYRAIQEKLIYRRKDKQVITPTIVRDTAAKLFGLQRDHLQILSGDKVAQPERERGDGKSNGNDYLLPEELSKAKAQHPAKSGSAANTGNPANTAPRKRRLRARLRKRPVQKRKSHKNRSKQKRARQRRIRLLRPLSGPKSPGLQYPRRWWLLDSRWTPANFNQSLSRMLHTLPIPNKDELFYSLIARLAWRLGIQESAHISNLVYGEQIIRRFVIPDLPRQLDQFQSRVPRAHPLAACDLVQQHTLFPIYSPFMPPDRAQALASFMRSKPEGRQVLPMPRSINRNPDGGLRVCPRCLSEDLEQTGETWWRRAHNVPGVVVCAKHRVFLVSTGIAATSAEGAGTYLLPPSYSGEVKELCPNDREHSDMLLLAQHAQWLLDQSNWQVDSGMWVSAYRSRLARLGYREGVQGNNFRKAARDFEKRFPPDFLSRLGVTTHVAHHTEDWLWRLMTYGHQIHPPLRHLLFWVWLDLAPGQVREQLASSESSEPAKMTGTLATKPPLQTEVGQERLKFLWLQPTVTFRSICAELQADYNTVQRHAKKLGLPFPRPVEARLARGFSKPYQNRKAKRLKERKRQWLGLCAKHPTLSRAQLRAKNQTLYGALYRSDPGWLKRHFPERKWGSGGNKADWAARDKNLLGRLQAQCDRMKSSSEFPCRISADAFERAMAGEKLYAYRLKHMPLSASFIKKVAESATVFAMRCVSFAAKQLRAEGKVFIPEELRVCAKISVVRAAVPEIKALIHELCSGSANRSSS